ncbi:MAG: hypothetical protein ACREFP_03885 [Acetobacteraceae bacterium]
MSRSLNRLSRGSYKLARASRDANAISRSLATGSPMPIIRRLVNKWLGRHVVRRMWWR